MKNITLALLAILILFGCDTYRGPSLINATDDELIMRLGSTNEQQRILLGSGQKIVLGGAKGGVPPDIHKIVIYDKDGLQLAEVNIDGLGSEEDLIITNAEVVEWKTRQKELTSQNP